MKGVAMGRKAITSPGAAAIGPYSHGVDSEGLVFPLRPDAPSIPPPEKLVEGGHLSAGAAVAFLNLGAVLEAAGPKDGQRPEGQRVF